MITSLREDMKQLDIDLKILGKVVILFRRHSDKQINFVLMIKIDVKKILVKTFHENVC